VHVAAVVLKAWACAGSLSQLWQLGQHALHVAAAEADDKGGKLPGVCCLEQEGVAGHRHVLNGICMGEERENEQVSTWQD
jgi:hypothetical protein